MAQRLKTFYASIVQNPEAFGLATKLSSGPTGFPAGGSRSSASLEVPKIEKIVINS